MGIATLNELHEVNLYNAKIFPVVLISMIPILDWSHPWTSFQIYLPISIWTASVGSAVIHAVFRRCFPRVYERIGRGLYRRGGWPRRERGSKPSHSIRSLNASGSQGIRRPATTFPYVGCQIEADRNTAARAEGTQKSYPEGESF